METMVADVRFSTHSDSCAQFRFSQRAFSLTRLLCFRVHSKQQRLRAPQVVFGIDADGVARCGRNVDVDAVVEQAQLLQSFDALDPRGRQRGKAFEGGFAVSVDSKMLAIAGEAFAVAIEWDGCAGKVKRAPVECSDYFHGIGIVDLMRRAADGERGDLDFGTAEKRQQRLEKVGGQSGFVALDVDVDVCLDLASYFANPVRPAGAVG